MHCPKTNITPKVRNEINEIAALFECELDISFSDSRAIYVVKGNQVIIIDEQYQDFTCTKFWWQISIEGINCWGNDYGFYWGYDEAQDLSRALVCASHILKELNENQC